MAPTSPAATCTGWIAGKIQRQECLSTVCGCNSLLISTSRKIARTTSFKKLLEVQVDVAALTDQPSGLVVISPLEIIHAIFLKAAEELGKAGVSAASKTAWKNALILGFNCLIVVFWS